MSQPYEGDSSTPNVPGITGKNTVGVGVGVFGDGAGTGVAGLSATGDGTRGDAQASAKNGVVGTNASTGQPPAGVVGGNGVFGFSQNPNASGVYGDGVGNGVAGFSAAGNGTRGDTQASANNGVVGTNASTGQPPAGVVGGNGVFGFSQNPNASGVYGNGVGNGVAGFSTAGNGVRGDTQASANNGVVGTNASTGQPPGGVVGGNGVFGFSQNPNASGVYGNGVGSGVAGFSETGTGVNGTSASGVGLSGSSTNGRGIVGVSQTQDAINGTSAAPTHAGVSANNTGGGYGLWAEAKTAGYFSGDVEVTGTVTVGGDVVLANKDCAEDFDIEVSANAEPGAVMVLDESGLLRECRRAYDKRAVGVVSGAGNFRPGLILGRDDARDVRRAPVALVGKVYCKVDARHVAIETGDLLTTSTTKGHAMKADDPARAFGAVIGKALLGVPRGERDLIPILVALQ